MTTRLERDALVAEVSSLVGLLAEAPTGDVLGRAQLARRLEATRRELTALEDSLPMGAQLSVLFGGRPVRGVESIDAEFAAKALDRLQLMVKKQIAAQELGPLPERGPLNARTNARLAITALEHASFGFRLEEVEDQHGGIADSPLTVAIEEVVALLADLGDEDFGTFEAALDRTDPRQIPTLRDWFALLEESEAVVRLAGPGQDRMLDAAKVHRARARVDAVNVREREDDAVVGRLLGITPLSRRFDMTLHPSGEPIRGAVSSAYSTEYLQQLARDGEVPVSGKLWVTRMRIREVVEPNRPVRRTYVLLGLLRQIDPPAN